MTITAARRHEGMFVERGDLSADMLRGAFGQFPSGVTAVCGLAEDGPIGIAASSFTTVSLDPPLVSVCVAHTSTTWPTLRGSSTVGVSVLAHDQGQIARALASRTPNRFESFDWTSHGSGAVFVDGAALWLHCRIVREVEAGDHMIVLLEIDRLARYDSDPIIFHASSFTTLAKD
jgi:flavin reductase (DIM6/NTAB) family NADH-FMN oxidoreductase RutF